MNTSHDQLNQISDAQWTFAPLTKFSPRMDEALTGRMKFWTAVVIASAVVLGKGLVAWLVYGAVYTPRMASSFIAYGLVTYLCYSLTFARAWNARAMQLRGTRGD